MKEFREYLNEKGIKKYVVSFACLFVSFNFLELVGNMIFGKEVVRDFIISESIWNELLFIGGTLVLAFFMITTILKLKKFIKVKFYYKK